MVDRIDPEDSRIGNLRIVFEEFVFLSSISKVQTQKQQKGYPYKYCQETQSFTALLTVGCQVLPFNVKRVRSLLDCHDPM